MEHRPETLASLFELGRALTTGKEDTEARTLYEKAAAQGYASAQNILGVFYQAGRGGLAKDDREAARLFKLAADRGVALGAVNLGFFHETGRGGLAKSRGRASTSSPLTKETPRRRTNLGAFYRAGRGGLAKDDREAVRLYKLAADQGNAYAQANLADFYRDGRGGLAKDDREAARLYKLAADQGNAYAQADLGVFYELGHGWCCSCPSEVKGVAVVHGGSRLLLEGLDHHADRLKLKDGDIVTELTEDELDAQPAWDK